MLLRSIKIENYRSIEEVFLNTESLEDGSSTYGLIGVNEAGKSNILKAIALKDGAIALTARDFRDPSLTVSITYIYDLEREEETEEFMTHYLKDQTDIEANDLDFTELEVVYQFDFATLLPKIYIAPGLGRRKESIPYTESTKAAVEATHKSIFWTAEEKYLISKPIDLANFSASPATVSVPLRNCFLLAGIKDIPGRIKSIQGDSPEKEELEDELGESVTAHIKTVWPNHPIKITFSIDAGTINFHVRDLESRGKAKLADQRSDGFKQFISFLLTISAQNNNEELSDTILLLDEPETHLHPQAQMHLLAELRKITQNNRGNVAFFATHSNYMIDKTDLSRNYRIEKKHDKTSVQQMSKHSSTYASVNYEVFGIPSSDYHNELYGTLHERFQDEDPSDSKRSGVLYFDTHYLAAKGYKKNKNWKAQQNQATLHTYIRNCIHHPESGDTYTDKELATSIENLRDLITQSKV